MKSIRSFIVLTATFVLAVSCIKVVTENMSWAWAYSNESNTVKVTVTPGSSTEVSFTNSPKEKTPAHDETVGLGDFSEAPK